MFGFGKKCTCGSGAHPRRCKKHPWAYQQHIFELNKDTMFDEIEELKDRLERIIKRLEELGG